MPGKLIGWTFDFIFRLWEGFWNVCGKILGLLILTGICGVLAVMALKLCDSSSADAWLYFKAGAFAGLFMGVIRILINEVAVPIVHTQERRERERRMCSIEAMARRDRQRDAFRNRLKHLQ